MEARVGHSFKTQKRSLSVAGLFAGIGGIELGLRAAGHRTQLLCEIDPPARQVLRKHFPEVEQWHNDITTLKALPKAIDLLTAGFPCQDLSQAGQTVGIQGARSGLVDNVFRLLRKTTVPLVLLENVPFMLQLNRGHAMSYLVEQFEELGYRWAYRVVDARSFGLPQRRRRVCFVAALSEDPRGILFADESQPEQPQLPELTSETALDDTMHGFYWTEGNRGLGWAVDSIPTLKGGSGLGIPSPPAIWTSDHRFGTPDIRDAERLQGFRANWTKIPTSEAKDSHRWKLVGNAVCVNMATWLGKRLARPGPAERATMTPLELGTWPTAAYGDGNQRYCIEASEWPIGRTWPSLSSFLRYPLNPLSRRAASGFLGRLRQSSLRVPPDFMPALDRYVDSFGAAG